MMEEKGEKVGWGFKWELPGPASSHPPSQNYNERKTEAVAYPHTNWRNFESIFSDIRMAIGVSTTKYQVEHFLFEIFLQNSLNCE